MSETVNISEVASAVSKDIFRYFHWHAYPKRDDNFICVNEEHRTASGKSAKKTHPGDVVFSYEDPYLGKQIYMHTDLKSYAADTITVKSVRKALKSLAMTVECARESDEWREKYGADSSVAHEVRGLLFVHNHDNKAAQEFYSVVKKVDPSAFLAPGVVVNFLGPDDIQRLYTIVNDLRGLIGDDELPKEYTYYYPDLVMRRRQGDIWDQPATFESLTGPFLFLRHKGTSASSAGYVIYYNRPGNEVAEFEYFLDCLSRYQMLDSDEQIRVRMVHKNTNSDVKSIFNTATTRYARSWGFDPRREEILKKIQLERVPYFSSNYNPGDIGWRE